MSTDESGVRTLLDQIYAAMNANDADAYGGSWQVAAFHSCPRSL